MSTKEEQDKQTTVEKKNIIENRRLSNTNPIINWTCSR